MEGGGGVGAPPVLIGLGWCGKGLDWWCSKGLEGGGGAPPVLIGQATQKKGGKHCNGL